MDFNSIEDVINYAIEKEKEASGTCLEPAQGQRSTGDPYCPCRQEWMERRTSGFRKKL